MMRRALLILALALAGLVPAARAATNYQDMWWNPSESGWGVNVAQQGNTMFATWFIYAQNNQPTWVVMANAQRSGPAGNVFTGALYTTTGPYYGLGAFNPNAVTVSNPPVGSATFTFSNARAASLSYTVNGVTVSKQITRQPLENINLSGTFYGGIFRGATCANSGVSNSIFTVAHTPSSGAVRITEIGGNLCQFSGTMTQFGSVFEGSGTYSCTAGGETGNWSGSEGTGGETTFSITLALTSATGPCTATFGGFKSP
ncbi:MAG TPA: hypothetical protein VFV17_05300 [Usitatibacteraceae bacterium]|nr:hypothetical protein [Usitatibacteraceae bacterium]